MILSGRWMGLGFALHEHHHFLDPQLLDGHSEMPKTPFPLLSVQSTLKKKKFI